MGLADWQRRQVTISWEFPKQVVIDGGRSKHSHQTSNVALSGVAIIVGMGTGKILGMTVTNTTKYATMPK